jgi:hypothetical protein
VYERAEAARAAEYDWATAAWRAAAETAPASSAGSDWWRFVQALGAVVWHGVTRVALSIGLVLFCGWLSMILVCMISPVLLVAGLGDGRGFLVGWLVVWALMTDYAMGRGVEVA